tara:strand:- start:1759 stop:2040 length:282 start_codon:yes stop_codon:yes gene_type:complete
LKKEGIEAERVPLSGACGGNYSGDIKLWLHNCELLPRNEYIAEVKCRKNGAGFKTIEKWLADNDLLFLKRDRAEPMVVLTWESFMCLTNNDRS